MKTGPESINLDRSPSSGRIETSEKREGLALSPVIERAIQLAIQTHEIDQKQRRKGKDVPYITHPLTVALILARAGASEGVIAAGVLHDTTEDSIDEKKVTDEMLTSQFGPEIATLVRSVSESDKSLSWEERKREALEHIEAFTHEELLLKSADTIASASETVADFAREGDAMFAHFNAPKEKIIQNYLNVMTAIIERWEENPLRPDLEKLKGAFEKMKASSL
jgi:(p)ppGpp synthase/HD superfamily hydrolase